MHHQYSKTSGWEVKTLDKKCPGQSFSTLNPAQAISELECPNCGYEVEFFPYDHTRTCPECGAMVKKSDEQLIQDFGCADWCPAAEKCLGPNYWTIKEATRKKRLEDFLETIPDQEGEVREFFLKIYGENDGQDRLFDPEKNIKPLKTENPQLYQKVVRYYSEFTRKFKDRN